MLGLRMLSGVPLFFALIGLLGVDVYFRCGWALAGVLALFAMFGVREFCRFAAAQRKEPFRRWAIVFVGVLFFATEYALSAPARVSVEIAVFIVFMLGVFLWQLRRGARQVLDSVGATILAVGYFWFFLAFILRLRHLQIPGAPLDWAYQGVELVFVFFVAVKICDIAGLLVGKRFGYRKISPVVSPHKSWEGFFGGMAASVATLALVMVLHPQSALAHCGYLKILPLGVLFSVFGLFGDLCESLFKREAQLKDAGGALPGYGGAMDMLDSLTFTAPICYYYFIYVCGAVPAH
ncbi:hypothetical protein FACS1894107_17290 [Planctomycetales bacterium]|nr:hypothetical protein FACS1894107_17290 [Planctomycetales bacterium]GHS99710.1 hypothetical protein FACS1894108_10230 [Planctomycetales bacterium]